MLTQLIAVVQFFRSIFLAHHEKLLSWMEMRLPLSHRRKLL